MATRSSIKNKNKAKIGAAASLAAGGVALTLDAGASDSVGGNSNALMESAFRLLEEGQNLFLADNDTHATEINRLKLEVNPVGMPGDSVEQMPQLASSDAAVSDIVMAQAPTNDIILAQAQTIGAGSAATSAPAAGVAVAAAETVAAPILGFAPLTTAVVGGVAATSIVAVGADNYNDTPGNSGGSDLNDDQDDTAANGSAKLFGFSGGSDGGNESSGQSVNADVIGGSSFIDDSTNSFFS